MDVKKVQAVCKMQGMPDELASKFISILSFLDLNPQFIPKRYSGKLGTTEALKKLAEKFSSSRQENFRELEIPNTSLDPVLKIIFENKFPGDSTSDFKKHKFIMAAETRVGALLEEYIASKLEIHGWIWCTGSITRSIDFIKREGSSQWRALQIKNRDNSENSSSSRVRVGTEIEHWFRTFSKSGETNWPAFPDKSVTNLLSEADFNAFVRRKLR